MVERPGRTLLFFFLLELLLLFPYLLLFFIIISKYNCFKQDMMKT